MTKSDKIKNVIYQAVEDSFTNQSISKKKVWQYTKIFSSISSVDAIAYLQVYLHGLRKYIQDRTLVIETPISLSDSDQLAIRKNLGQKYSIMGSSVKIDTSLLGGLRIKIGDVILDDSVKTKIDQLGEIIRI